MNEHKNDKWKPADKYPPPKDGTWVGIGVDVCTGDIVTDTILWVNDIWINKKGNVYKDHYITYWRFTNESHAAGL